MKMYISANNNLLVTSYRVMGLYRLIGFVLFLTLIKKNTV